VEVLDRLKARHVARMRDDDRYENWVYDPETLKMICLDLIEGAKVRLLLHAWAVGAVMEGDRLRAAIIESKSGRQAIRGQVFVDGTGDGDTAAWAGVPHECSQSPFGLGLDWRWANVDFPRYERFCREEPDRLRESREQMRAADIPWPPGPDWRDDRAYFITYCPGDALNVRDLTRCEVEQRRRALRTYDFYRAHIPGFEDVTILDTASQIGTRESRRIAGGYMLKDEDVPGGRFEDSIGTGVTWTGPRTGEAFDFPYRTLVPQRTENLVYAGRCISADHEAHQNTRVIPNCFVTGQGAGVAAAQSARTQAAPRDLSVADLQAELRKQGVEV